MAWHRRLIAAKWTHSHTRVGRPGVMKEDSLVRAIAEYAVHYHEEWSHQGIGNELMSGVMPQNEGSIEVSERLGGLLKYYHRRAA